MRLHVLELIRRLQLLEPRPCGRQMGVRRLHFGGVFLKLGMEDARGLTHARHPVSVAERSAAHNRAYAICAEPCGKGRNIK